MREILFYSPIWDFTAEALINKINEVPDEEDIRIRVNSPGGSVFAGWSIIGKMNSRKGKTYISVDGHAASMAFLLTAFADGAEALDVTRFMVHRASGYIRTPEDQALLDSINADLLGKLKKRLNLDMFKEIAGKTLDEIFKAEEVINVWLTSRQAKDIGLIDKIERLNPKKLTAYTNQVVAFIDFEDTSQGSEAIDPQGSEEIIPGNESQGSEEKPENKINVEQKQEKKMTKKEFKASDPEAYAEIMAEGATAAVKAEQDRVKSWLAFLDIDRDNVIKAIKDGTEFTQSVMAEMTVKLTAKKEATDIEDDGADGIATDPPAGSGDGKEAEAFEKEIGDGLNLKNLVL